MDEKNELDFIVFIDTNIFLDLYKLKKTDVCDGFLNLINGISDKIITTSVVEMEFKKNRQRMMTDLADQMDKISRINLNVSSIIADTRPIESIRQAKEQFEEHIFTVKSIIKNLLANPMRHDRIYQGLSKVFSHNSAYKFDLNHTKQQEIQQLALKRFGLGYPPRKANDTAIGDSVNWEWVLHCAETSGMNIIMVTRDRDFGVLYDNRFYLNDWLKEEFHARTKLPEQQIHITPYITEAVLMLGGEVEADLVSEEKSLVY